MDIETLTIPEINELIAHLQQLLIQKHRTNHLKGELIYEIDPAYSASGFSHDIFYARHNHKRSDYKSNRYTAG